MNVVEFNKKLDDYTDGFVIIPTNQWVGYAKADKGGYGSEDPSEWANWHLNLRDVIICRKVTVDLNNDPLEGEK